MPFTSIQKKRIKIKKVYWTFIVSCVIYFIIVSGPSNILFLSRSTFEDECEFVYLDVGTNVGIEIRKLFEPQLYNISDVIGVFDEYFGHYEDRDWSKICAIGFEPNPKHEDRLKKLKNAYLKCGWKIKIFTKTAVSDKNGITTFYSDENEKYNFWGSSIIKHKSRLSQMKTAGDVKLLHLSEYINKFIGQKTAVVMKMDIEGSEIEVIPDLILRGSFQYLDSVHIEFHNRFYKDDEKRLNKSVATKTLLELLAFTTNRYTLRDVDNEQFGLTDFDLPKC